MQEMDSRTTTNSGVRGIVLTGVKLQPTRALNATTHVREHVRESSSTLLQKRPTNELPERVKPELIRPTRDGAQLTISCVAA